MCWHLRSNECHHIFDYAKHIGSIKKGCKSTKTDFKKRCAYKKSVIWYPIESKYLTSNTKLKQYTSVSLQNIKIMVYSGASITSWGEGASLDLVSDLSSDGVTIKKPCEVDVSHPPASNSIFSYWVG